MLRFVQRFHVRSAAWSVRDNLTSARIPNFDPDRVVRNAWGTLTFTFADGRRGRVDFSSVAGFGSGSMELTRLTLPAGLTCP